MQLPIEHRYGERGKKWTTTLYTIPRSTNSRYNTKKYSNQEVKSDKFCNRGLEFDSHLPSESLKSNALEQMQITNNKMKVEVTILHTYTRNSNQRSNGLFSIIKYHDWTYTSSKKLIKKNEKITTTNLKAHNYSSNQSKHNCKILKKQKE